MFYKLKKIVMLLNNEYLHYDHFLKIELLLVNLFEIAVKFLSQYRIILIGSISDGL